MTKETNREPSDARILEILRENVDSDRLHPANLQGRDGNGNFTDRLINAVFHALSFIAQSLPPRLGYGLFARLGQCAGWITPPMRKKLTQRLRYAFPEAKDQQLAKIRSDLWKNSGRTWFEILDHTRFVKTLDTAVEIQGIEHLHEAQEQGRPIVVINNHQANWELMLHFIEKSVNDPLAGLYAPLSVPQLNRRVLYRRIQNGNIPFPRNMKGAVSAISRHVARGKPILITLDQRVPGILHPFFGVKANSTIVPIRIAQKFGARLIPIQLVRLNDLGKFRLTFHPSLLPDENPEALDPVDVLTAYNTLLEGWIREHPADWFWLHDRWK